jgi:hypothetical protein
MAQNGLATAASAAALPVRRQEESAMGVSYCMRPGSQARGTSRPPCGLQMRFIEGVEREVQPQNIHGFATPAPAIMLPRSTTRSRLAVIHRTENFHVNRCFVELHCKTNSFRHCCYLHPFCHIFLQHADQSMMDIAFRVLVYLRDRAYEGITYSRGCLTPDILYAYADSSHAPSGLTGGARRRSRSGIMLVLNGAAVSWISKCQTSITLSACEAEYISDLVESIVPRNHLGS